MNTERTVTILSGENRGNGTETRPSANVFHHKSHKNRPRTEVRPPKEIFEISIDKFDSTQ